MEIERARLTHQLARIREADGDIVGAADILQEMQVETYGSMEKTEKVMASSYPRCAAGILVGISQGDPLISLWQSEIIPVDKYRDVWDR